VAGVLGVLLGPLGVHRFYLGFIGIGLLQAAVTFVTLGIGGVWGFIEGVLCLTGPVMRDVDGLPLRA
jgi:TM2 domain-containing membrane protein YozV